MNESEHDDLLLHMLKECKTPLVFLDHVFGFLKRRSDFYLVKSAPDSPVGLPHGLAEGLVRQSFMRYVDQKEKKPGTVTTNTTDNDKCSSKEVKQSQNNISKNRVDSSKSYNGAIFDNYSWSQSYNEVDLYLKLPPNVSSRNLEVRTTSTSICIKLKTGSVLLEGEMCQKCKLDPVWSIESEELQLHLEKSKEIWWDCFLQIEPRLDIQKLDCTKPLEDLPEEAQAKIEELQWNQEQKRLGLPTSDQLSSMETMKKAWNAEGSPFSGPFDPSTFHFS